MATESFCPSCGTPTEVTAAFCEACGKPLAGAPVIFPDSAASPPQQATYDRSRVPSIGKNRVPMARWAKIAYAAGAVMIFCIFAWVFFSHLPGKPNPVIDKQPDVALPVAYAGDPIQQTQIEAVINNGDVVIPLPELLDKKIVAFDYPGEATKIPLLAYINSQGKLVTAFRFCEPCNSETYRIEGGELCCGNCESKWKLDNLDGIQGACMKYPPNPIPSTVVGNQIHISESLVRAWKTRL